MHWKRSAVSSTLWVSAHSCLLTAARLPGHFFVPISRYGGTFRGAFSAPVPFGFSSALGTFSSLVSSREMGNLSVWLLLPSRCLARLACVNRRFQAADRPAS